MDKTNLPKGWKYEVFDKKEKRHKTKMLLLQMRL